MGPVVTLVDDEEDILDPVVMLVKPIAAEELADPVGQWLARPRSRVVLGAALGPR